jgi:isopentenyldiphosphate isomerase
VGELLLRPPTAWRRTLTAARRRLTGLGIDAPLTLDFSAATAPSSTAACGERVRLRLFRAADRAANPDPAEVSDVEFASADDIARGIASKPDRYVYWLRHAKNHGSEIARIARRTAREAAPIAVSTGGRREAAAARR